MCLTGGQSWAGWRGGEKQTNKRSRRNPKGFQYFFKIQRACLDLQTSGLSLLKSPVRLLNRIRRVNLFKSGSLISAHLLKLPALPSICTPPHHVLRRTLAPNMYFSLPLSSAPNPPQGLRRVRDSKLNDGQPFQRLKPLDSASYHHRDRSTHKLSHFQISPHDLSASQWCCVSVSTYASCCVVGVKWIMSEGLVAAWGTLQVEK